jgi:hypothetical protein
VVPGTFAAQYFVPGDIVLGIQGYSAADLLHMEAIDLVRQPVKSLELFVQKIEHIPASIWGPEPVLKRPSEWLRQSPSPVPNASPKSTAGFRAASVLGPHFEAVSQSGFQQEPTVRTAYTPTALDSRLKRQFESFSSYGLETSGKMPETSYQKQMFHHVSSAIQHVVSDLNRGDTVGLKHYCDTTHYIQGHNHVHCKVPKGDHTSQTPQGNHKVTSGTPQQTNHVYGHQLQESFRETAKRKFQYTDKPIRFTHPPQMAENIHLKQEHVNTLRNDLDNSNKNVAGSTEGKRSAELGRPGSRDERECNIRDVTEKPRISAITDISKRPLSPEFTTFPNSRSNSLLKMVLSKSLLNYSPQDFEKMRAAATETYDESHDDEDSDTEDDEDEDAEEADNDDEDPGSTSCDSSLTTSGSAIFERCWTAENNEEEYSDDSELRQYAASPDSLGRNSSEASASSPFPDSASTSDNYTG